MISRIFTHAAWPALLACIAAASCSSPAPTPEAMVSASLTAGPNGGLCPFASDTQFVTIGTPTGPKPVTVSDGGSQGSAGVAVACTVIPSNGGFEVQASATIQGSQGGTLTIIGHVDGSGGSGLHGGFTGIQGQSFDQESGCTVTYKMNGQSLPTSSPVGAGHIWGHIDCPAAQTTGQYRTIPDGGSALAQCEAQADFFFDNCTGGSN